ncbi:hypothetical protein CHS0354_040125 [Potamilus streckersoni]|uniref:G-protein coupled receptors family 2 profile 2 domain-containing protein n=1 Tax=Potamilus streckersoni TaxID=2493646 RepID=A0AAE0STP9_9BIVA|nr:hypothetical protein CHS0354_040125 [Potamilus streckersoni]
MAYLISLVPYGFCKTITDNRTQYLHTESSQQIPDTFATFSLLWPQDEFVFSGIKTDFTAAHTAIYVSKSSSSVVPGSRSSNSLENMLLFGSYPRNTGDKTDSFNVTFSRNFADVLINNLYYTKEESSARFKVLKSAGGLRWDASLESILAGFNTDSRNATLIKNTSICKHLLESSTFTKDSVTFNDTTIPETNLRLDDRDSTSSVLLTAGKGVNTTNNFLIASKDPSEFKASPEAMLSEIKESVYSKCDPEKFHLSISCDKQDGSEIKFITIGKVSGPVCPYAECLHESKVCECDQECLIYNDCCLSYLFRMIPAVTDHDLEGNEILPGLKVVRERVLESYSPTMYKCHEFIISYGSCVLSRGQGFLMIGLCPSSFSNEKEKQKCEMSEDKVGIQNIPVVHNHPSGINVHFKNAYCALCHNISVFEFTLWDVEARCDRALLDNLNYSDVLNKCVFQVTPPQGSNLDLRTCIPNNFLPQKRELGRPQLNNIKHNEHDISSICQSYVSPIAFKAVNYRNMHCATDLTGEREFLSSDSCLSEFPKDTDKTTESEFNPRTSLKIIFDFSPKEGLVVRTMCNVSLKFKCREKEMYDCLTRTCRTIYCLEEQAVMDNCVPLSDAPWRVSLPAAEQFLTNPDKVLLNFATKGSGSNITDTDIEYYKKEVEKFVRRLDVVKSFNITACDFVLQPVTLYVSLKITVLLTINISLPDFLALTDTIRSRENQVLITMFTSIVLKNYQNESELHCKDGDLHTTITFKLIHENTTTRVYLYASKILANIYQFRFKLAILPTSYDTESISYCWLNLTGNLNCRLVFLGEDEYRLENGSLYLINTTKVYRNGTYVLGNTGAFVCFNTLIGFEKIFKMFDYSPSQWILSIVTKTLSMAALLAIIFFHFYFPNLRNLHGLNLTALSATLILANCLLLIYHIPTGTACQVTGILLHFLWISVFVWLNIIGFDVTRTFQSGWMSVSSNVKQRFGKYFIAAFGIPLLLVTICVIFHVNNGPINIEYGMNNQCWLGSQKAVIIFFLAPIIISVLINIVLLGMTIFFIERAKKMTQRVRSRKDRVYCMVYFKLTVILGLSWVVGIIAVFVDIPELWYVHIIFNGLQGLSIFICFVLNARFQRAMRKEPSEMKFSTKVVSTATFQTHVDTDQSQR